MENNYFVIASVEGLELTTDLMIGDAIFVGNGPDYCPVLPKEYREPRNIYGSIPFANYLPLKTENSSTVIDDESLQEINRLSHGSRISDHACLIYSITLKGDDIIRDESISGTGLLDHMLRLGDQIVDLLRVFLYEPGDERIIGRVGSLGRGVYGAWLVNSNDQTARFIGRRLSRFALIPDPIRLDLESFRKWYITDTFRELRTAVTTHPCDQMPLYDKLMAAMRSYRESREVQCFEARLRQLTPLIEDLANNNGEGLSGWKLYERVAQVAWYSLQDSSDEPPLEKGPWRKWSDLAGSVSGLWKRIRNPLAHTCRVLEGLSNNPRHDLFLAEVVAVSMIRGLARACFVSGATEREVYEILSNINVDSLEELSPEVNHSSRSRQLPDSTKNPLQAKIDTVAKDLFGQTRRGAKTYSVCVICRSDKISSCDFVDDLSRKEFTLSGLCQPCQEKHFADFEIDE